MTNITELESYLLLRITVNLGLDIIQLDIKQLQSRAVYSATEQQQCHPALF